MIVVYGATGFTGRLVARRLVDAGHVVAVAGRRADAVAAIAASLDAEGRVGTPDRLDLTGATALVNCAGPFSLTQRPLLDAALQAGVHYLDLAGEVDEHVAARAYDQRARSAGCLVLPGAGFGIVPSEAALIDAVSRVDQPIGAELALRTVGGVSRGTAGVILGGLRTPGVVRRGGALVAARAADATRKVDFGDGGRPVTVATNPWRADLAFAVPDVPELTAYQALPLAVRLMARVPHGSLLRRVAARLPEGPSEVALAAGRSSVWARAHGADGSVATTVIHGPDAYLLSADSVELCVRHLADHAPPGFTTPAGAWGPNLALALPGVTRQRLD